MYVPNGGYKSDNSKTSPSTRVLAVWRANAAREYSRSERRYQPVTVIR